MPPKTVTVAKKRPGMKALVLKEAAAKEASAKSFVEKAISGKRAPLTRGNKNHTPVTVAPAPVASSVSSSAPTSVNTGALSAAPAHYRGTVCPPPTATHC